jgi:hypothetical protein
MITLRLDRHQLRLDAEVCQHVLERMGRTHGFVYNFMPECSIRRPPGCGRSFVGLGFAGTC